MAERRQGLSSPAGMAGIHKRRVEIKSLESLWKIVRPSQFRNLFRFRNDEKESSKPFCQNP
jgi:hypothetical protein